MLAERISAGQLRPGQRLGAERALAADLGVSRATLRQALAVLATAAWSAGSPAAAAARSSAGTRSSATCPGSVGVPALLRSQGVVAGTGCVSAGLAPADEPAARALRLKPR